MIEKYRVKDTPLFTYLIHISPEMTALIIVCSPSLDSLSNNIYADLDANKKHTSFDEEFMNFVDNHLDKAISEDEPERTLILLDDVASELKSSMNLQRRLSRLIMNRRHKYCSLIITTQYFRLVPLPIRSNISHLIMFRPTNNKELEALMELIPISKTDFKDLIDFIFDKKYRFLFLDLSLKKSNTYRYFKNFDRILI